MIHLHLMLHVNSLCICMHKERVKSAAVSLHEAPCACMSGTNKNDILAHTSVSTQLFSLLFLPLVVFIDPKTLPATFHFHWHRGSYSSLSLANALSWLVSHCRQHSEPPARHSMHIDYAEHLTAILGRIQAALNVRTI